MASTPSDDAFARYVNQIGHVTLDQLDAARNAQAEQVKAGMKVTLADVLVLQGVLTQAIRLNIENKLRMEQSGGAMELGRYKLVEKLGEGGMGAVYLAIEAQTERKVAVKILPPHFAQNTTYLQRFRREAKAATKLQHDNIVSAIDVGEANHNHYYVMEYCAGEPLDKLLKRLGRIPWLQALTIALDVARGLKHAHQNGFAHRDIKPANIFLARDPNAPADSPGVARILDLGLAKHIMDGEQSFQTASGVLMGTPHYISPEQAQAAKDIDGRTDIYSLGAMLFHMLTGRPPFEAETMPLVVLRHINDPVPNPREHCPDIPDGVVHIVEVMMAKRPADRYADCAELIVDLEAVLGGKAPVTREVVRQVSASAVTRPGFLAPATVTAGKGYPPVQAPAASTPKRAVYAGLAIVALIVGAMVLNGGTKPAQNNAAPINKTPETPDKPVTTKTTPETTPTPTSKPPSDEIKLDVGVGPPIEMIRVPAGEFAMGTNWVEAGEAPVHHVTISKDFYLGRYELTVAQFRAFADAVNYVTEAEINKKALSIDRNGQWAEINGMTWRNPGFKQADDHPVCVVTWKDAEAYCAWASEKSGRRITLPTEAQWEYAARGEKGLKYPWGNEMTEPSANLADTSLRAKGFSMRFGELSWDDGHPFTAPVGSFAVNKSWCGAMDLSGNVWEWTADNLFPYPAAPQVDPLVTSGSLRLLRGGAWNTPESTTMRRVAPRTQVICASSQGFRIAAAVEQTQTVSPEKKTAKTTPTPKPALPAELKLDLGAGPALEMVHVPAGEFNMGSIWEEGQEAPVHRVTISRDFYLGRYEVTVAQFRAFAEAAKYQTEAETQKKGLTAAADGEWKEVDGINWRAPGFKQADDHPVCVVTWKDAEAYAAWASEKSGRRVFLPTEAQWEYAARGAKGTQFPWGNDWIASAANVADKSLRTTGFKMTFGSNDSDDKHPYTAPVGSFPVNRSWCGVLDMSGNVWEWCADNLANYSAQPQTDPLITSGSLRVVRGGAWNTIGGTTTRRIAPRAHVLCGSNHGFRVAAEAEPTK